MTKTANETAVHQDKDSLISETVPVSTKPKTIKKTVQASLKDIVSINMETARKTYQPALPNELIAGAIPHIPGSEDESVWNAAVQACGTERVHFTYTINDGKCWYLATPSSHLASHPDSWCPLAAALPGNSEFWDTETVYIYEKDGQASALRWDTETNRMQLFLGPSRTILPKVQSMEANFVTVNPETADVIPWVNLSLRSDMLSQATVKIMTITGVIMSFIVGLYIMGMYTYSNVLTPRLEEAREETKLASMQLINEAERSLENESIDHIIRIQALLDTLLQINGTLVKYSVNGDQLVWEALVPPSFITSDAPVLGNARPINNKIESDGRVRIRGNK